MYIQWIASLFGQPLTCLFIRRIADRLLRKWVGTPHTVDASMLYGM